MSTPDPGNPQSPKPDADRAPSPVLEVRVHRAFERERESDNQTLKMGFLFMSIAAAMIIAFLGISRWQSRNDNDQAAQQAASNPVANGQAAVPAPNVPGQTNPAGVLGAAVPTGTAQQSGSGAIVDPVAAAQAPAQENAMPGNSQSDALAAQEAEAARQKEQAEERQQAELQAKSDWVAKCSTQSRQLTTRAGNDVALSDQEASQLCGCTYDASPQSQAEFADARERCLAKML